jgi:hypothetical protein
MKFSSSILPVVAFAIAGTLAIGCRGKQLQPTSAVDPNKLEIVNAVWGVLYDGPTADVTKIVADKVKDNVLTIQATTALLGEPANHKMKRLRVEYKKGDITAWKIVGEEETLRIPKDERVVSIRLVVTKAVYGDLAGGKTIDVTKKVADMVNFNTLSVTPTNFIFGDPADHKAKRLHVDYTLDGTAKSKEVYENETLTIAAPGL